MVSGEAKVRCLARGRLRSLSRRARHSAPQTELEVPALTEQAEELKHLLPTGSMWLGEGSVRSTLSRAPWAQ